MIPGARMSYDLEINDRNGKTKAPKTLAVPSPQPRSRQAVRVTIDSPGDPSSQYKGGGGGKGKGAALDSACEHVKSSRRSL